MAGDRRREWRNETNVLAPAAGSQAQIGIGTTVFDKGCTVVRIILDISVKLITPSVNTFVFAALWTGSTGGVPNDITAQGNDSFLLWLAWEQIWADATIEGSTERITYRSFDVRGQRVSRQDGDNIQLIVASASGGSNVSAFCSSRVLCLLP